MCDHRLFQLTGRLALTAMAAATVLSVFEPTPVRAQTITIPPSALTDGQAAMQTPAAQTGPVRQLTIDDAVALALEQNLDLQVQRINPQIQDLSVSVAQSGWTPNFQSNLQSFNQNTQPDSALSGGQSKITNDRVTSDYGIGALLPWGANYNVGWANGRQKTNNLFTSLSPRLSSSVTLNYTQPLLRNLSIDNTRQQYLVSRKNREISDVQLQQTVASTLRNVKNAYWDLVYAIDNLAVQRESLELAQRSLKENRARVEIGTMAPIDIIQAEAEVAQRESSVIVAESSIGRAEDRLRALTYDPKAADFWTMKLQPSDHATFTPIAVDTDAAVRNALDKRTDLTQTRKQIESNDINIRYFKNQTMPDVNAVVDYSAVGLGGTTFQRGEGSNPLVPGDIIPSSVSQRSFGTAFTDSFRNLYPTWTFSLQFNYPIGRSNAEASMARARLQNTQAQKQLDAQELSIATQIRDLARSVQTNGKRVEATRAARALAQKRLESEEKKFQAGMTSSFFVVQAQRDLNQARNDELQAIIDHVKSGVDLETAQLAPLTTNSLILNGNSGGASVTSTSTGSNVPTSTTQNRQQ
jgi:outer membrane protein